LQDVVAFLGPLSHSEVVEHLHRASVACVPSIIDSRGETEGMPTVVIEAMASGLRVVGSNVDGIPDLLKNRINGWLAAPADSKELAEALRAALSEPSDVISQRAIADSAQHDWSKVADEYAAAVRSAGNG
jgi:glycosyltransferase involved in cell wall biosynthesis